MRFREDRAADLIRARDAIAAWREQHPQGTAGQLVHDLGRGFHEDYGVVLRAVLFAVDSHGAKITTGISIVELGHPGDDAGRGGLPGGDPGEVPQVWPMPQPL